MYQLFVDESYQKDHYYVSGVLVDEKQSETLVTRLNQLALFCIDGDIEFVDSRDSRGVQAADMSVYVLRRHREEASASKSARRATTRLVKALGPALVHEQKWLP